MTLISSTPGYTVRQARLAAARRKWMVTIVLSALILGIAGISIALGDFNIPLRNLLSALAGQGDARDSLVVWQLRMPRILTAILVGATLGMSGALFQSLVRNPLASPDIIGITSGASASAVMAIIVLGVSGFMVSFFAFGGALIAAALVYVLAWRGNGVAGFRFVLIGIAMAAILSALVSYMMTRANIRAAQDALFWLTGSLHMRSWEHAWPLIGLSAILALMTAWALPQLRALQLGDEAATALGTRVEIARRSIIIVAVGLASVATAAAGPIPFVALMAGAFGRLLIGGDQSAVGAAALVGALIVLSGDFLGQHLVDGTSFPVGVITGLVGAPYLIWLLIRAHSTGQGE